MNKIDEGTTKNVRGQVEIKLQRKQRRYSGRRTIAIVLMMMIAVLFLSAEIMATNEKGDKMSDDASLPTPKLTKKIDLSYVGKASCISRLAFSPDGRYLSIVDDPYPLMSTIIIWDLQQGREQTRIENLPPHTNDPDTNLLWGADGKYITFGKGYNAEHPIQFWDPMTGKVIKEIAVSTPCGSARLNWDKSKMLIRTGTTPIDLKFRIYNTKTWEFNDYTIDNDMVIQSISWTSEDKLLIAGLWPKGRVGRLLDGRTPEWFETTVRLVDPSNRQNARNVVLSPPVPSGVNDPPVMQGYEPYRSIVDFTGNKIAFGYGKIIDGHTLDVLTYASNEDIKNHKIPTIAKAFSPDGSYLYLLGFEGKEKSLILDVRTGKRLAWFDGGKDDIAVSPDGKQLVMGGEDNQSVKIFSLK